MTSSLASVVTFRGRLLRALALAAVPRSSRSSLSHSKSDASGRSCIFSSPRSKQTFDMYTTTWVVVLNLIYLRTNMTRQVPIYCFISCSSKLPRHVYEKRMIRLLQCTVARCCFLEITNQLIVVIINWCVFIAIDCCKNWCVHCDISKTYVLFSKAGFLHPSYIICVIMMILFQCLFFNYLIWAKFPTCHLIND